MIDAIFGCGGFGREVMAFADADVFIADEPPSEVVNGKRVMPTEEFLKLKSDRRFVVAVADSIHRKRIVAQLCDCGALPYSPISGVATLCQPRLIGRGSIICAYCSIHPNVVIGEHFHCNIYSYVAHDCVIGDYVTFAPRVNCNGGVRIGDGVYIGTGAVLRDHITIGPGAVIGMGAVVTKDVSPGAVVVGNPAGILRWNIEGNPWIK